MHLSKGFKVCIMDIWCYLFNFKSWFTKVTLLFANSF